VIAKVIVDISLDREFDYAVPPDLAASVCVGSRVGVPFGHRQTEGYVIALAEGSDVATLKPIAQVIGDHPFIDDTTVKLARWMANYYCARLEQCIRTLLPGAVRKKGDRFKKQRVARLIDITLANGITGKASVAAQLGYSSPLAPRARLDDESRLPVLDAPAPPPQESTHGTDIEYDPTTNNQHPTTTPRPTPTQRKILDALHANGGELPVEALLQITGTTEAPLKTLAKHGMIEIETRNVNRDPFARHTLIPSLPLDLMPEQATALESVREALSAESPRPILLHGVTGSGKTEVYLQGIAHALEQGKGAIVLVPEIALTPQTVERFRARFGDRIAVLHSNLSDGERHDEWHRIRSGEARVVIGARSAVFAPVRDLGLIIVDEEHEPSYKQSDAPRYNARDVAVMRAHLLKCVVLLGSATPALESWANAQSGKYRLCTLSERADYRQMPAIRIVDMRIETQRQGHAGIFSKELLDAIHSRLSTGEQTMLFLNRRGFSSSLVCPKCGFVSECHQCSVSHTYHRTGELLRCHMCGCTKPVPAKCPQCADPAFRYAGFGTQRVEAVMHKCFPHARIARLDADTTTRKTAYEDILGAFRDGKIDILVGTQMIAKGLHFPNVTLVGVVFADLSLHVPDFRAGERTFQLIAQVAGRAGRGDVSGDVYIQTYTPHHTAIQSARRLDYEGFCAEELEFRRELDYPPAAHLICLTLRGRHEGEVQLASAQYARALDKELSAGGARVSEAVPAPLAKIKNVYRYQIIIRSRSVARVTAAIKTVYKRIPLPATTALSIDVDALDLM